MRKRQRFTFLAIGAIGLAAAIGPGLAATLTVPLAGTVPAAGQGTVEVQGFIVSAIDWVVSSDDNNVDRVSFTIVRSESDAAAVNAVFLEDDGDAVVRVRLEEEPIGTPKAFVSCIVTSGSAVCDTSATAATMTASTLAKVNIIAFDRN